MSTHGECKEAKPTCALPLNETLFDNAEAYFSALIESIQSAQQTLDLEVYIYESYQLGINIAKALTVAANNGVRVRLLTDGVGIDSHFAQLAQKLNQQHIEVRIHKPLPWRFEQWRYSVTQYKGLRKLLFLILAINQRNHRKTAIADGKTMFLGSINVSHNHLNTAHGGSNWRDTALKIEGTSLEAPIAAFELSWNYSKRAARRLCENEAMRSPFLFNYSRKLRKYRDESLHQQIRQAEDKIFITNAYFVPESKLLKALVRAANKGVDIRIIMPAHSDIWFMPWVSSYFYSVLLRAGVKIFEYEPAMLHAKTLIIDTWCTIGSSNLNHRSFRHDLEVDYILQSSTAKQILEHGFYADQANSEEQTLKNFKKHKGWRLLAGAIILKLFGNWL